VADQEQPVRRRVALNIVLGMSMPTVKRHWAFARAWLFNEIRRHRDL
jgi:hypothetical protein